MKQVKAHLRRKGLKMEVDREEFALALKTWRLRSALTQRQVAEKWGTSRFTIIRAESGHPISWEQAYKLFAKLARELEIENAKV